MKNNDNIVDGIIENKELVEDQKVISKEHLINEIELSDIRIQLKIITILKKFKGMNDRYYFRKNKI
jgi:hypothetical protein